MQDEINEMVKYMTSLEERVFTTNTKSLDLLKRLRTLELESMALKNYII